VEQRALEVLENGALVVLEARLYEQVDPVFSNSNFVLQVDQRLYGRNHLRFHAFLGDGLAELDEEFFPRPDVVDSNRVVVAELVFDGSADVELYM